MFWTNLYSLPSGGELDLNGRKSGDRHSLYNVNAVWLFRKAVRKAGYYDRGGAAVLSFYDRLGEEIESACEASRFDCGTSILSAFPPWHPGHTVLFFETFWKALARGLVNDYDLNIGDFFTIASPKNVLSIARLTNAAVRMEEASNAFLPSFYLRTTKVKTKYRDKIRAVYQVLTPLLAVLALPALLSRALNILRTRRVSSLDVVLSGLWISIVLLLVMFTMLMMTGVTASSRLYFLFYPVLFPLVLAGALSLARDLSRYRYRFRTDEADK